MIKSKKQMFIVFMAFTLVLMLGTVTYAFFNYTRTGTSNIIKVGRITFNSSQTSAINLTNAFPITSEEAETDTTNAKQFSITITGDTDYNGGIEYLVTATDVNLSVANKEIPVTLDINVDNNGTGSLGTLETGNYYENRNSYTTSKYKIEYDGNIENGAYLLVGYIAKNETSGTAEGINGIINIKAFIDKDRILISDTYDGSESDNMGTPNSMVLGKTVFTTEEWNSFQTTPLSFKIKVEANEGIWVSELKPLQEHIVNLASTVSYIENYDDIIENHSYYETQDTVKENENKETVYYYTGVDAKENSNVLFGGYCWQIVRTTDNGGVRLLYNGLAQKESIVTKVPLGEDDVTYVNNSSEPFTLDEATGTWTSTNHTDDEFASIKFHVKEDGYYAIDYNISTEEGYDLFRIYKYYVVLFEDSGNKSGTLNLGYIKVEDDVEIEVQYSKDVSYYDGDDEVSFVLYKTTSEEISDNVTCQPEREGTKGVVGERAGTEDIREASLFGRSYDYNLSTGEFTILDSVGLPTSWSESTANELKGTYSCLSNSNTCSSLYYIGSIYATDPTKAWVIEYKIDYLDSYNTVGRSPFNANNKSAATVGYMFNEEYDVRSEYKTSEYYTTAIWDQANSVYVLSNGNSSTTPDGNHHYICDTDCSKVRYYFLGTRYYVLLENGDTVADAIYKMIGFGSTETINKNSDYKLNKIDSSIKGYLEHWYRKNLLSYTSYLDKEAVYCNDRGLASYGGWRPTGANMDDSMVFYRNSQTVDLSCVNVLDRYSVSNNDAKINYSIGLLTEPEAVLMGSDYTMTGFAYTTLSPADYSELFSLIVDIDTMGAIDQHYPSLHNTTRPVITLKPNIKFSSGNGSYNTPYVVGPIIVRSE